MREALIVLLAMLGLLVFERPVAAQVDRAPYNLPAVVAETPASFHSGRQPATDYERAPAARSPSRTAPRLWYGWQTVTLDLLWLSGLAVAGVLDVPVLAWSSLGVGVLGVPLIHLAQGNYSASGVSLGLRLGAGLLIGIGVALALSDASDDSYDDSEADGVLGWSIAGLGAAGMLATMIVDATLASVPRAEDADGTVRLTPRFDLRGAAGLQLTIKL